MRILKGNRAVGNSSNQLLTRLEVKRFWVRIHARVPPHPYTFESVGDDLAAVGGR